MKVNIKSKQRVFEPIEITISIESKDELIDFFNRSRITLGDLYSTLVDKDYVDIDYPLDMELGSGQNTILYSKLLTLMGKLNKHSED